MKSRLIPAIMAPLLVGVLAAPAAGAEQGPIVAIFAIEDKGARMAPGVLGNLMDYLSAQLVAGGYQVLPPGQIRERLRTEKIESYKECYDQSCQIELGRELAAEKTLSTKILRIGGRCQLTAVMYDLRRATAESAATEQSGCGEKELLGAVRKLAARLCEPLAEQQKSARRQRVKNAWLEASRQARDDKVLRDLRVQALESFIFEFKGNNPFEADAGRLLDELRFATLQIRTAPPGAAIQIEGKPAGTAPVIKQMKPGSYEIVAVLDGYQELRRVAKLLPGKTVDIALQLEEVRPGKLTIRTEPAGADVFIDDEPKGITPTTHHGRTGKIRVVLRLEGYETVEREAMVTDGQETELGVKLEPRSAHILNITGHVAFWSGLAFTAFGGVALSQGWLAADEYRDELDPASKDTARTWTGLMYAGFGAGVALMAAGAVLWALEPDWDAALVKTTPAAAAGPTLDGKGVVFSLGGRW